VLPISVDIRLASLPYFWKG